MALPPGGPITVLPEAAVGGGANPYVPYGTDPLVPFGVWTPIAVEWRAIRMTSTTT